MVQRNSVVLTRPHPHKLTAAGVLEIMKMVDCRAVYIARGHNYRPSNLVFHECPHASIGLPVVELFPASRSVLERPGSSRAQPSVPNRIPVLVKVELQLNIRTAGPDDEQSMSTKERGQPATASMNSYEHTRLQSLKHVLKRARCDIDRAKTHSSMTRVQHLGHDVVNARYLHVLVDRHIGPERRRWVPAVLDIVGLSAPAGEGAAPVIPNSSSLIYRRICLFLSERRFLSESRLQGQEGRQRLVCRSMNHGTFVSFRENKGTREAKE